MFCKHARTHAHAVYTHACTIHFAPSGLPAEGDNKLSRTSACMNWTYSVAGCSTGPTAWRELDLQRGGNWTYSVAGCSQINNANPSPMSLIHHPVNFSIHL